MNYVSGIMKISALCFICQHGKRKASENSKKKKKDILENHVQIAKVNAYCMVSAVSSR